MSEESASTERSRNIWAPWRIEYLDSLSDTAGNCFLCRYRDEPEKDETNLVLWRGGRTFAVMNRFPYTGGHAMVAPFEHVGDLSNLDPDTMREMMELLRDLQRVLRKTIRPQGFNIGMNVGRCAGAGLPEHLHVHIVPRWEGDTNFMTVFGGARVISQALEELYSQLRKTAREMKLPKLTP